MGELQQKYQQRLGSVSSSSTVREADQMLIDTLKHELDGVFSLFCVVTSLPRNIIALTYLQGRRKLC